MKIKTDNQEIEVDVSEIVCIKLKENTKKFIYFEEMNDGTFRMAHTEMFKEIKGD